MEAKSTRKRWTYSEFARLPESGGTRFEVIDDQLAVTPTPSLHHQRIAGRLFARLFGFVEKHRLGEVFPAPLDVLLAEGDYLEPDIVFVRKDRADILSDRGVEGAPDLVVEILSPSTEARDYGLKLERYRLFGVTEYWIVDPDKGRVEVWELAGGKTRPVVSEGDDSLRWTPIGAGATLTIDLSALFRTS